MQRSSCVKRMISQFPVAMKRNANVASENRSLATKIKRYKFQAVSQDPQFNSPHLDKKKKSALMVKHRKKTLFAQHPRKMISAVRQLITEKEQETIVLKPHRRHKASTKTYYQIQTYSATICDVKEVHPNSGEDL